MTVATVLAVTIANFIYVLVVVVAVVLVINLVIQSLQKHRSDGWVGRLAGGWVGGCCCTNEVLCSKFMKKEGKTCSFVLHMLNYNILYTRGTCHAEITRLTFFYCVLSSAPVHFIRARTRRGKAGARGGLLVY